MVIYRQSWLFSAIFCGAIAARLYNLAGTFLMVQNHFRRFYPLLLLLLTSLCVGQSIYFPAGILGEDAREDNFKIEWYSKFLTAMHEPSLCEASKTQKTQTYRFLWLRSFHQPVSVRLEVNRDGTALLTTKITSGNGGYEPRRLIVNRTQRLTREHTSWVLDRIEELKFWSLPTNPPRHPNEIGVDGAQWIFEGAKDGAYHVVDRWSPEKDEIHALGIMMLIDLAKLKLLYQDVY